MDDSLFHIHIIKTKSKFKIFILLIKSCFFIETTYAMYGIFIHKITFLYYKII